MELSKIVPGWQANKDATPQKIRFLTRKTYLFKRYLLAFLVLT